MFSGTEIFYLKGLFKAWFGISNSWFNVNNKKVIDINRNNNYVFRIPIYGIIRFKWVKT